MNKLLLIFAVFALSSCASVRENVANDWSKVSCQMSCRAEQKMADFSKPDCTCQVKKEVVSKELIEIQSLHKKVDLLEKKLEESKKPAPIASCPASAVSEVATPHLPVKKDADPLKDFLKE